MIALDRGAIAWIDGPMVRREAGLKRRCRFSLASRPRALSEHSSSNTSPSRSADQPRATGLAPVFSATQYFAALPAAGRCPPCVLTDALGFRQTWFPPAVDVDFRLRSIDELPALIEVFAFFVADSSAGESSDLTGTGVVLLAPSHTRPDRNRFDQALASLTAGTVTDPGAGTRRPPVEALTALMIGVGSVVRRCRRRRLSSRHKTRQPALGRRRGLRRLARFRRRIAAIALVRPPPRGRLKSSVAGVAVPVAGDDAENRLRRADAFDDGQLADQFKTIQASATPSAWPGSPISSLARLS